MSRPLSPNPGKGLNPLAGSFQPSWAVQAAKTAEPFVPSASPVLKQTLPAEAPVEEASEEDKTSTGVQSPSVQTQSLIVPGQAALSAHSEDEDDDEDDEAFTHHQRAHILSPHTRTNTQRTYSSSTHSSSSSLSELPTRRSFFFTHYFVQFPLSFFALLAVFISLLVWDHKNVRWVELGLGAAAWLASEPMRAAVFQWLTWQRKDDEGRAIKGTGVGLPTVVHAVLQEALRLGALLIAVALLPDPEVSTMPPAPPHHHHSGERRPLPPLDTLFFSALWLALGWAIAEVISSSLDFQRRMRLYDDILDNSSQKSDEEASQLAEHDDHHPTNEHSTFLPSSKASVTYGSTSLSNLNTSSTSHSRHHSTDQEHDKLSRSVTLLPPPAHASGLITPEEEDEEDALKLDALIRRVERSEVEAQLGIPLYEIPVAVVIVWRLDAILLSLVLTLLLSLPSRTTSPSLIAFPLLPTFIAASCIHSFLSLLWVLRIPRMGLPSLSYATLVILVVGLFGVLGAWGALE